MPTTSKGLCTKLDELHAADRAARARIDELRRERSIGGRDREGARADLRFYFAAVESGDETPDPKLEAELRKAISDADAETAEAEWEGKLVGAQRAAEGARLELEQFRAEHREALIAELFDEDCDFAARYVATMREGAQLHAQWLSRAAYKINAIGVEIDDVHRPPFDLDGQAVADFEQRLQRDPNIAPTIRSLTEGA